ncbi:hypothetical protein L1987_16211 [Smallanthus sonchifolius]|uniref:Uncharacterized protein n=1 Tax=Smallanthus sonchifolius TaxID=185202 RepID=A0ACB9J9Y9_9ASTR|nr:hypothetical protein L1987_16211 [Smallanthus sonchifolius]
MSCNGCRVLRKGWEDDCILRPCLAWITSPESQANATLFLAKFYGRAGLLNLINAAPHHLRPDTSWEQCQSAVDSVLQGSTIMQLTTGDNHDAAIMPLEGCDIRHLSKDHSCENHRVKIRNKFKRPGGGSSSSFRQVSSTSGGADQPEENQVDDNESGKVLLELSLG